MALRLPFGGALLNMAGSFLGGVAGGRGAAPAAAPVATPAAPSAVAAGGAPRKESKMPFGLPPIAIVGIVLGAGVLAVMLIKKA